jgi:hypothetical protein
VIGTATAGNNQATVTWTAPSSNGGSAITTYDVTPCPTNPAGPCGAVQHFTAPATTATVTGLVNGTTYTFTVTATNAVGTGPASAASNGVTPTAAPPPPVAARGLTSGNSATSGTTVSTGTISSMTPNALELAAIDARSTTANTIPTLSGCNLTWVPVTNGSVAYHTSPFKRVTLFRAQGSAPSSSCTLTFNFGSTTMTNFLWTVSEFTNVPATNAVVQAVSGLGVSGTASVTLAALASTSATFGVTGTDNNTAVTPGSGFTELHEQVSGYTKLESEWRSTPSQTVSSTFSSTHWGIVGAEIARG